MGRTGRLLVDTGTALARLGVLIGTKKKETQGFKAMTPILASGPHECWTCYSCLPGHPLRRAAVLSMQLEKGFTGENGSRFTTKPIAKSQLCNTGLILSSLWAC